MDSTGMNSGMNSDNADFAAVEPMNVGTGVEGHATGPGADVDNSDLATSLDPNSADFNPSAPRPGYSLDMGCAGETLYLSIESLRAPIAQPYPMVFVAGEFHNYNIWLTKPDGGRGWAYDIADAGFKIYCPELSLCWAEQLDGRPLQRAAQPRYIDPAVVEIENTAPEKSGWLINSAVPAPATGHDKWPGTGQQGDAVFERYISTYAVPSVLERRDRQRLGQRELLALLAQLGPSIIVAEGSGATVAWLAADAAPSLVKAVIAVEPAGGLAAPPSMSSTASGKSGGRSSPTPRTRTPSVRTGWPTSRSPSGHR